MAEALYDPDTGLPYRAGGSGPVVIAGATLTRPADTTPYAVGDLVANSTTAGSVVPLQLAFGRLNGGYGGVRRMRLSTNKTGLAGTEAFRVRLYKNSPTLLVGDNAALASGAVLQLNGIASIYLGKFDITLDEVYTDGAKGLALPAVGQEVIFDCSAGSKLIYAIIEARSAYTPASGEILTLVGEVLQV